MKQRNNTARTKRKKKMLKLKAFFKRVFLNRHEKKMAALKPKGQTIYGEAKKVAVYDAVNFTRGNHRGMNLNQRQKRKIQRQSGIYN